MMKHAIMMAALCVVTTGAPPARGQLLVEHSMYGINTHVPSDAVLARLEAAGIAWARIDINWYQIQPTGPDHYNWGFMDAVIASADARGIHLFPTLGYTPGWANGSAGINFLPDDANDWKNFVRAVVNRYRGSIHHWGMWNEPNLDKFLDASAVDYVNTILIPGAQAVREADPDGLVLGPEVSGPGAYIETVLDRARDHLDIITVHKYGPSIETVMNAFDGAAPPTYEQILQDAGVFGTKPVWLTEVGWATAIDPNSVSEAGQASNYVALLDAVRQRGWIEKVFFYEIADDPTPTVSKWGVLNSDLSEKLAYGAYAADIAAHPPAAVSAPTDVSIDLGVDDIADGMTHPPVADGDTQPAGIGGRACRRTTDPNGAPADRYFYFAVDDTYTFAGNHPEHYITIDYFDAGAGSLVLQYDSSDPAPFPNDRYKNGGNVGLADTQTWRRHTFHVTDGFFGNRQNNGADFRIYKAAGAFHLDRVRVTRPPASADPTAAIGATPTRGAAPLHVSFTAAGAYDLDGAIAGYAWDFDDNGTTDSIFASTAHEYATDDPITARLTVTDNDGLTDSTTVTIWPGCTTSISNLNRYALNVMATGTTCYADRPFTITSIPSYLDGAVGIRTADADFDATADAWITFDTTSSTEVYVAYDAQATLLPGWLVNFVETPDVITLSDPQQTMMRLYRRIFADETVSLGGNLASGASGAERNYVVLVRADCTVPTTLGKATDPTPEHAADGVGAGPVLSWTPGRGAKSHNVYFGRSNPPFVFKASGPVPEYVPDTLAWETTYYWRVDEVNESGTLTGDVWSFTTGVEPAFHSVPASGPVGLILSAASIATWGAVMVRRRRALIA